MPRLVLLGMLAALAGACAHVQHVPPHLPVPVLADPVQLRVAVVSNPALPPIGDARISRILQETASQADATFGVRIRFGAPVHVRIAEFFRRFDAAFEQRMRSEWIHDFKRGAGDAAKLAADLERGFRSEGSDFDALYRYAKPHLVGDAGTPAARDLPGLAQAVARTHLARLERLRTSSTAQGARIVPDEPYNEFVYWEAAGHWPLAFEVVITNQLLASAEYKLSQLHSSLRGGISNGLTTECRDCAFGTYSLLSTHPFWGDDPVTTELRGGHALSEGEAVRAAALLLVHELGHQLFHYGHPFGQTRCVMNPARLLRFREWIEGIDDRGCEFGAHPTLKPGFYKFEDLRAK